MTDSKKSDIIKSQKGEKEMEIYLVRINGYFETIIECSHSAIAIATAIDYFGIIDDGEIEEIKVEKF